MRLIRKDFATLVVKPYNKYRNKRIIGGYASAKEARRAQALKLLERAGKIRHLREQVPFTLIPSQRKPDGKAERPVVYFADFVYEEEPNGFHAPWPLVVEDVKGFRTPDYVIKRKLMLRVHGIAIRET